MWTEEMSTEGPMLGQETAYLVPMPGQREERQQVGKETATDCFRVIKGTVTGLDTAKGLNSEKPAFGVWV